ncbi:MAG: hypothetical protein U0L42_07335 [Methanobrevibacter sp.]|uniref:hypothetical protein n=1 Tax=Methanobrevibacter sp. TaxID=66852 RepID=UPI002E79482C|nr:hypothetical protein [Methanobrevibacter sp.]MEE0935470.1 hypothetical protein [Methanobrevibacter sp.]
MRKLFITFALTILIIGCAYANDSTITINDADFTIPSKYHGGELTNTSYKLDNIFSIRCIDDNVANAIGLWAREKDSSEDVNIAGHPVRHYYSYNEYVDGNISHAYFASGNSTYEIKWTGSEITGDIKKLIKNTPKSDLSDEAFYNTLDKSINIYKEQKISKLNQDAEYNYLESRLQSQSNHQNTPDDTQFNRILLTYYNR